MGNKTSFKSRFTLVGGGGGGDNSVTQMAMMDDDNVSAAYTHGGGNAGLTLHSRWKSQFDDSEGEGSENETEMKGEHLQSPEHKQAPPAAADAAKAEKERNASGGSGGGNALTRGGKSLRKKIRASFRMKSTRKGCLIHIRAS